MNLTTAASVNARRGRDATEDQTLLESLIAEVSADVDLYLQRHTEAVPRTEIHTLQHGQRDFRVKGYPIASVASVSLSPDPDFSASEILPSTSYHLQLSPGRIHLIHAAYWEPTYVQVTYTGGMGADTAAFMAAFPDLVGAIDSYVLELLKRADKPGVSETRLRDGGVTYERAVNMPPLLKRRLSQHKRTVIL